MIALQKMEHNRQRIGKYIINYDQIIGRGATATVFKGETIDSKEIIAIKLIDLSQNCDVAQRSLLDNQCKALKFLDHPNLIRLVDIIQHEKKFFIVTKFYEGVTLAEYLQNNELTQEKAVQIFKKIMEGTAYLIEKNILHRDLKPANIIIDRNLNPIIIDFGFCEIIHEAKITRVFNVGSPSYMSPQAYLKTLYSQKSQSWSLSMILYELLHRKTLDKGIQIKDFYEKVRNIHKFVTSQIHSSVASELREVMEKSFQYNSIDRMSVVGMKYSIDRYFLNRQRQEGGHKLIHAPSAINIEFSHPKKIIKFNQHPNAVKDSYFASVSPLKKRQVSIKFIHPPSIPHPRHARHNSNNEHSRQQQPSKLESNSKETNPQLNMDYFSNKIKKGVFDLKRFSRPQENILTPHSNMMANIPHYPPQQRLIIKQI